MNEFDRMINNLNLLNETELEGLAEVCRARIEGKKKARREALRQELMANLQQTISAILGNGFDLTITNTERNYIDGHEDVWFCPDDHYSIEIE